MLWISIPQTTFQMGITAKEETAFRAQFDSHEPTPFPFSREMPTHNVHVKAFSIAKTPATNQDYFEFVQAGGYENEALWTELWQEKEINGFEFWKTLLDETGHPSPLSWREAKPLPGTENHPVSGVCWFEAQAFAAFHQARLPSEAEWELAARGKDGRAYPWGHEFDLNRCPNGSQPKPRKTVGVDQYPQGASPFGLMHLVGNVGQWCVDRFHPYPGAPLHGEYIGVLDRVVRGDFFNGTGESLRVTARFFHPATTRFQGLGIRLAKDPDEAMKLSSTT